MKTFKSLLNNSFRRFRANVGVQLQHEASTTEQTTQIKPPINSILPCIMLGCGTVLMLIWPVIETIALRNILLFTGGSIGLWYLIRERTNLYQKSALPLLFILLFIVWLVIHNFSLAHNPLLEAKQITGTWLRVIFACFLGISTGLFARHHQRAQQSILAGIFLFVIIFYFNYAWVSFTRNSWEIPYPNELGLYGNKISIVFYGLVSLALACGVISHELMQTTKNSGRNILAAMFYIALVFLAFIFVGTKNGVALSLILIFSLFAVDLFKSNKSYINIFIASIFIGIICFATYWHLKLNPEWHNFLQTVATGVQIDRYPNWQDLDTYGLPKLADGTPVSESAYLRAAFATEGVKLLLENPLGYGLVDESFKYLTKANFPKGQDLTIVGTHSGWLDFSLGLGIPGLFLIWAAFASAIFYSYEKNSQWSYVTRWILAASFLAWTFAEISSSHFVETLFYLIALLSAGNLPIIDRIPHATSAAEITHI
jgi:hypothetical protein